MVYGRGGGFYLCGCLSTAHTPYWKHTKTKDLHIVPYYIFLCIFEL